MLVSVTTALLRASLLAEGRLIRPRNGEARVAVQQVTQGGGSLAERQARRQRGADLRQQFGDESARQRLGVVDPQELVALHVDRVGDERVHRDGEVLPLGPGQRKARCWPSTIQPGLRASGREAGSPGLRLAVWPSLTLGPRLQVNRTVDGSAMMIGLGNRTSSPSR